MQSSLAHISPHSNNVIQLGLTIHAKTMYKPRYTVGKGGWDGECDES